VSTTTQTPLIALYRYWMGEHDQSDYVILANFAESYPTYTASIPLGIVDSRLREKVSVSQECINACVVEAIYGDRVPTFRGAALIALASMAVELFPGNDGKHNPGKWLELLDDDDWEQDEGDALEQINAEVV
jgi:hypothetical protein